MPIVQDGLVLRGTRQNLIQGLRAKPMREAAVDAVLAQALRFSERLVEAYEANVAQGEVGATGSARAAEEPILGDRPPTALLYGRVQSGKTAAMVLSTAICLDNGFRVIVVLTANNVALVRQTANRFKDLDGPRVFSTIADDVYEWEGQEAEIEEDTERDGLVLVCAKDSFHLPRVIQFLQRIDAPSFPALVLDDEADAATPDTTLAARTSGRPNAPTVPSTINRRVLENPAPGEEGESIGEILPHSIYAQVTATPFLFFLQRETARIRPTTTFLLEAGEGYCGGEAFFADFDARVAQPSPPIVLVPDNEALTLAKRRVPQGLASSIEYFLVAAAAGAMSRDGGRWPEDGFKHLSHTSARIGQHATVAGHIERHITALRRLLRADLRNAAREFADAHAELRRTLPDAPPLERLAPLIFDALRQVEVVRVNSTTDEPTYGPRVTFLIGGNILGRGLTIDDLLVTYYLREAQTSQMDTVWQHARMYGYRRVQLPLIRVYLPRRLAALFKEIHESEEQLRDLLRRESLGEPVPIRVAARSRPTRPNATEPSVLQVFRGGQDQLHPNFPVENPEQAAQLRARLAELGVPVGIDEREQRSTRVPFEAALQLLDLLPKSAADPARWSPGAIRAIIESYRDQMAGEAIVYVRLLQREAPPPEGWTRGRLSGPEIRLLREAARGTPAIAIMLLGDPDAPRGWYPTLVLPPDASTFIVNPF